MEYIKISGKDFEKQAQQIIFEKESISLTRNFKLPIGISNISKNHNFDLGCEKQKVIVECKCHSWTQTGNKPSAKMSIWNEAMFYFMLAPKDYRKILFVRKQHNLKLNITLAKYYMKTYSHFVPENVEIWEYDSENKKIEVCEI